MKIAVIGATGGTGQKVVGQLLEADYEVIAVARNQSGISINHQRLEKRSGDVLSEESIKSAIKDAEIVVSALGTKHPTKPTTLFSDGMNNVLKAMNSANIKRIVIVGASGYIDDPPQPLFLRLMQKYLLQKILHNLYTDMLRMEKILFASAFDWTIVRPARLTNGERTQKYRIKPETVIGGRSLSRADVADYVVNHLTDEKTYRKAFGIAY